MIHVKMFTLSTAGSVQELAKMVDSALGNFEVVASTTDGNIREDVRGIGCMLYAGTDTCSLVILLNLICHRVTERRNIGHGPNHPDSTCI